MNQLTTMHIVVKTKKNRTENTCVLPQRPVICDWNVYNHRRRIGKNFFWENWGFLFCWYRKGKYHKIHSVHTADTKYMFVYQVRCTNEITIKLCGIELDRLCRTIHNGEYNHSHMIQNLGEGLFIFWYQATANIEFSVNCDVLVSLLRCNG